MNTLFYSLFLCNALSLIGMDNRLVFHEKQSHPCDTSKTVDHTNFGSLSFLNDNFTIKIPTKYDSFLIQYGVSSGNVYFEKNGKNLNLELCSQSCKKKCLCSLLKLFKINNIDHNHSECYVEATENDISYEYETASHYKKTHDNVYMIHDNQKCCVKKIVYEYKNDLRIKVPKGMMKVLGKL